MNKYDKGLEEWKAARQAENETLLDEQVKKMCPFIVVDGKHIKCLANGCAKWEANIVEHIRLVGFGAITDGTADVGGKCGINSFT